MRLVSVHRRPTSPAKGWGRGEGAHWDVTAKILNRPRQPQPQKEKQQKQKQKENVDDAGEEDEGDSAGKAGK